MKWRKPCQNCSAHWKQLSWTWRSPSPVLLWWFKMVRVNERAKPKFRAKRKWTWSPIKSPSPLLLHWNPHEKWLRKEIASTTVRLVIGRWIVKHTWKKWKKKWGSQTFTSGIFVIEVNLSTSTSSVLDTGYRSHICLNV